ncbi:MAG: glycosyltransferase family 39 protein [Thermoanaerobaculia bacterium]
MPDAPLPRRVGIAVAVLLVLSFALRLWFAGVKLDAGRFYDERFSFRNVSAMLVQGHLKPNNAYYPSLSYLPHTAVLAASEGLYRVTGWQRLTIFDDRKPFGFSATAYFLGRTVSVVLGTLSLWLVFVLGRRLFSTPAGLLAAALLAAAWGHVQASAVFKPDILVVVLALVTFVWSLDAAEQPSLRRFLVAGVGVGLAASAKYNGAGVAVVVVAAALASGWRDRRRWAWLMLAGCASAVAFVALNPYLPLVFEYLGRQQNLYEGYAVDTGGTHWGMPREQVAFLIRHHGPAIFGLAVAGCLGLTARIVKGERTPERLRAVLILSFVLGYSAFYAALTPLFRGQNYLPVTAFTSLAAAWAMVTAWRWAAERWSPLRSPSTAWTAGVTVAVLALSCSVSAVYREVVPSTAELAGRLLQRRLQPVYLRQLVFERSEEPVQPFRKGYRMPAVGVDRLRDLDERRLDLADGEVFPASRLEGAGSELYLRRLASGTGETLRVMPGFLSGYGPELVVRLRGWPLRGEPLPLLFERADDDLFTADLPASIKPGEVFSISLWLPAERGRSIPFEVRLGSRPLQVFETRVDFRRAHYLTPRMEFAAGSGELSVRYGKELDEPSAPEAELCRWQPPSAL